MTEVFNLWFPVFCWSYCSAVPPFPCTAARGRSCSREVLKHPQKREQRVAFPFLPRWASPFFILERNMHCPGCRAEWTHHKHPAEGSAALSSKEAEIGLGHSPECSFLILWDVLKHRCHGKAEHLTSLMLAFILSAHLPFCLIAFMAVLRCDTTCCSVNSSKTQKLLFQDVLAKTNIPFSLT